MRSVLLVVNRKAAADGQHSRGRQDHRDCPPQPGAAGRACRLTLAPTDEAEGYRIQRALHDLLLPQVGPLVGYKIGCTSAVMQQYLDIPHPCGGGVFAKGVHDSGASLRFGDYVRVGVECEIAVSWRATCRRPKRRSRPSG